MLSYMGKDEPQYRTVLRQKPHTHLLSCFLPCFFIIACLKNQWWFFSFPIPWMSSALMIIDIRERYWVCCAFQKKVEDRENQPSHTHPKTKLQTFQVVAFSFAQILWNSSLSYHGCSTKYLHSQICVFGGWDPLSNQEEYAPHKTNVDVQWEMLPALVKPPFLPQEIKSQRYWYSSKS